jgi:(1->4)-alpha-D-glucan 1-alpha-D-glucosylmutase
MLVSLARTALKCSIPGVPDFYQGTDLWDLSLVDPDNRRPVDYDSAAATLAKRSSDKQRITSTALRLRRDRPDLFTSYTPLHAEGPAAEHVLAFDRGGVVTVATRLPAGLAAKGWGETTLELPEGSWTNVLTGRGFETLAGARSSTTGEDGGRSSMTEVLGELPVALLVKDA